MTGITFGTNPEDAIRGMSLIHIKDRYKTNTKTVHWSGADESDFPAGFIDAMIPEPSTLAIWKGNGKIVIAWVE